MPAHLDEPRRAQTLKRVLDSGCISMKDVEGNCGADKLANQGREQRQLDSGCAGP